ncbi:hypothetical protein Tco_0938453, partial [Tanacetum coccineum]
SSITELIDFIEAHDHLHPIFVSEHHGSWGIKNLVVVHELETCSFPARFGEVQLSLDLLVFGRYRYCKNHKKTVKAGQTRTRERKENTKAGRMLLKSYTSPNAPIGGNPKGNDTRAKEKTHQSSGICTKMCVEEAQVP